MLENAPAAIANAELEKICRELNARNVSVKELAEAAGVTYRAMARRLGK
jgi:DNA-binding Xre family transcriptional regulator